LGRIGEGTIGQGEKFKKKIITKAYKTIFSPTNTNKTQMNITM
jgi:hypothetical protein